jgi:hypothetical protein
MLADLPEVVTKRVDALMPSALAAPEPVAEVVFEMAASKAAFTPTVAVGAATHEDGLTFMFRGMFGGVPCRILMDTGAERSFVDDKFVQKHKRLQPHLRADACDLVVRTATNELVQTTMCCAHVLEVQKVRVPSDLIALPGMMRGVDVILGTDWLRTHEAQLDFGRLQCRLTIAGKHKVLHTKRGVPVQASLALATALAQSAGQPVLSAKQARKLMRRGAPVYLFLVQCEPVSSALGAAAVQTELPGYVAPAVQAEGTVPQSELSSLLAEFADVFQEPVGVPPDRGIGHVIRLVPGADPPYQRPYRLGLAQEEEARKQIKEMLEKGWIEPSNSPFGAPLLFVPKPDGSLRMVIDYRALNKLTVRDRYPLPRIDDMLDRLSGCTVFSALDLASGYYQLRINEDDVEKTAFVTPMGQMQFRVLSMGLCNAPSTFQRMVAKVFGKYMLYGGSGGVEEQRLGFILCYLDDILIASKSAAEHAKHLHIVWQILREHKLHAKLKKCDFNKHARIEVGGLHCGQGWAASRSR